MSAASKDLIVGGSPRVNLLPPEVKADERARGVRRGLTIGVFAAVLVAGVAYALATVVTVNEAAQLSAAQDRTTQLLSLQNDYVEVRDVASQVDAITLARQIGTATEMDWKAYFAKLQAPMPATMRIVSFAADVANPVESHAEPTSPLEAARVGTIQFTVASPTLLEVETWLRAIKSTPAYADAVLDGIDLDEETLDYRANISLHINADEYTNRFAPDDSETAAADGAATDDKDE